jgi:hypothetical protein
MTAEAWQNPASDAVTYTVETAGGPLRLRIDRQHRIVVWEAVTGVQP